MRLKKAAIAAIVVALAGLVVVSSNSANAVGNNPNFPAVPGTRVRGPGLGQSITVDLPAPARQPGQPADWNPTVSETVTGVTHAQAQLNATLAGAKAASTSAGTATQLKVSPSSALLSASNCWTASFRTGTSALHADLSQTWCGNGSYITDWWTPNCWGYSAWWMPTYAYLGCHTSYVYGKYWNQGISTLDADLCPGYYPATGWCAAHSYVHNRYYFTPNGYSWQL